MKKISNTEEANQYYTQVNNIIDSYVIKNKIKPSRLKKYLNTDKLNKLIEKNGLKDIEGIKRVFQDVIEDFESLEKDGIMKFESYNLFESEDIKISSVKHCLYKGVPKAEIKHEKALADILDVSLGHIETKDSEKHIYTIDSNNKTDAIIYSDEDIEMIGDNIIEFCYNELSNKKIDIIKDVKIDLGNLIDKEEYMNKLRDMFSQKFTKEIIHGLLSDKYFQEKEHKGYHVWVSGLRSRY